MKTPEDEIEELKTKFKELIKAAMAKISKIKVNVVNTAQAVETYGLSRQTLYELRKSGELVHSQVGSRIFYEVSEFEKLVRRHRVRLNRRSRAKKQAA